MEFTPTEDGLRLTAERHYALVPKDGLTDAGLDTYRTMNSLS